jgi:hypothetical protein
LASTGRPAAAWPIVDAALTRWPSDPDVIRSAAEVASLDPRHVTPAAEVAISRPADVVAHHNRAVAALNSGDGASCLQEVEAGLTKAGDGEKDPLLELGYSCAVHADDAGNASRLMMARRSVTAFSAASVVRHAELLLESDQPKAAGRLLELVRPGGRAAQGRPDRGRPDGARGGVCGTPRARQARLRGVLGAHSLTGCSRCSAPVVVPATGDRVPIFDRGIE